MWSRNVALLLLMYSIPAIGRDASTQIIHFYVEHDQLPSMVKTFINKTKHPVRIRWRLTDRQTREFIGQEPIIMRNNSLKIDVGSFLDQFSKTTGLRGYDFSIEVARVLNAPQQKGDGIQVCSFKNGASDLQIHKTTFFENNEFKLLQDKYNILSCKAVVSGVFN